MAWTAEFYEEGADRNAPVQAFLEELSKQQRAKAIALIQLLEQEGVNLPFPYSSQVKGRLRELRTQFGKDKIRILYFADERQWFILLHGIIKRTPKLEAADIRIAEQRMSNHTAWLRTQKGKHG